MSNETDELYTPKVSTSTADPLHVKAKCDTKYTPPNTTYEGSRALTYTSSGHTTLINQALSNITNKIITSKDITKDITRSSNIRSSKKSKSTGSPTPPITCPHCPNVYAHKPSLYKHLRKHHQGIQVDRGSIGCNKCSVRYECTLLRFSTVYMITFYRVKTINDLKAHLQSTHNETMEVKEAHFNDLDEFLEWKESEEIANDSVFVQQCAPKTTKNSQVWYYYCNRAGVYTNRSTGSRQTKSQGTNKIGDQCTAHMRAEVSTLTKTVSLRYCFHHIHETKLSHLCLPSSKRMEIAGKLYQGIPIERIMDDIRDSVDGALHREHMATKQDLHNIKNKYNIEGVMRHSNDLTSVTAWVYDMSSLQYDLL